MYIFEIRFQIEVTKIPFTLNCLIIVGDVCLAVRRAFSKTEESK